MSPSFLSRRSPADLEDSSGPRPPADYPFSSFQHEGTFAVPVELQEDYSTCRIPDGLVAGYWTSGSYVAPIHSEGIKAIRMMGDVEGAKREGMRHLEGEKDFAEWIHGHRFDLASRAVRGRVAMAPLLAMSEKTKPCPACGTLVAPAGGVVSKWVTGFGSIQGCTTCLETLAFLVGAEMVARHDRLELLQAHARALVATKVGANEITAGDEP